MVAIKQFLESEIYKYLVGLTQDPDFNHLAGLEGLQCNESIWDMRPDVIQVVRSWSDDEDSNVPARHVLLMANVLVYCDEDVKVFFSQGHSPCR